MTILVVSGVITLLALTQLLAAICHFIQFQHFIQFTHLLSANHSLLSTNSLLSTHFLNKPIYFSSSRSLVPFNYKTVMFFFAISLQFFLKARLVFALLFSLLLLFLLLLLLLLIIILLLLLLLLLLFFHLLLGPAALPLVWYTGHCQMELSQRVMAHDRWGQPSKRSAGKMMAGWLWLETAQNSPEKWQYNKMDGGIILSVQLLSCAW